MNQRLLTKPKTNKFINGETVSYSLMSVVSLFILFAIKQLFKTFFGVSTTVSCVVAFIVASAVSYFLERRFVFAKKVNSSNAKQIIFILIRFAVNFAFYKLADFAFYNLLDMPVSFAWFISILTAFLFNYVYDRALVFDCDYEANSVKKFKNIQMFF